MAFDNSINSWNIPGQSSSVLITERKPQPIKFDHDQATNYKTINLGICGLGEKTLAIPFFQF